MKPVIFASIAMALFYSHSSISAPVCQSADSDSDNDGWGWENYRSCIVTASSASQTPATEAAVTTPSVVSPVQTSGNSTTPVCTSATSDPDGDGWGWESNRSCIVTVNTQSASATQSVAETSVPEVAAATAGPLANVVNGLYRGRHKICSSASADIDGDGWGYENYQSCKVVAGYIDPQAIIPTPPAGNSENTKAGEIYSQTFSNANTGLYQADELNSDWENPLWHLGFDQGRVKIINAGGSHGNVMEVTYPAGKYGAGGASAFLSDVQFGMGLPESYEELYVAYDIRFEAGFDFVKGGKLPGLCGADTNQAPSTGCNTGGGYPSGYDGWSARGMWRENGALENYVYHASQRNYYGDDEFWNVSATPGVWHRVEHRVVLNTPGQKNGILEAWFDGEKVMSLNNIEYRKTQSVGINLFYFSTFFGGNDASWAPATDQKMTFDNFVLSTGKID